MQRHRTGEIITAAAVNFIFAAYYIGSGILGVLMSHAEMSKSLQPRDDQAIFFVGWMGLLSVGFGVVGLLAGIGILRLAFWGHVLCIIFGSIFVLMGAIGLGISLLLGGLPEPAVVIQIGIRLAWGIILLMFCFQRSWRQAFSNRPTVETVA